MSRVARGISGVVCVLYTLFALAGCSGASEHGGTTQPGSTAGRRTTASVALKTKYDNPEVAACMQRNGITVLSNGGLQVSKTTLASRRKAVEKRCGFGVKKVARPARKATTKPPARKPQARKLQTTKPQAQKTESFRDRLVAKVVACLHREGVSIPTSDSALLSSTSGIITRSPRVKAAIGKCRVES